MNIQKLEKLYQIVVKTKVISFDVLINDGFLQQDIEHFVEDGILECTCLNEYKFCDITGLYKYGIKIYYLGKIKDSYLSFLKCYELDSQNADFCIQLILFGIKNGHYNQAFEHFKHLEQISVEKDKYNNNLYLYLFTLLTGCPDEYLERVNNFDFDSVQIPYEGSTQDEQRSNYVRQAIMKFQYRHALFLQNEIIATKPTYSPGDTLLKDLIVRVLRKEEEFQLIILDLAKNQNYKAIVSFIENKKKKRYLSNNETYILLITKAIINIINTHEIPSQTINNTEYIYEAIVGNNYRLAQKLLERFNKNNGKKPVNEILNVLLGDINNLISQLQYSDIEQIPDEKVFVYKKSENQINQA